MPRNLKPSIKDKVVSWFLTVLEILVDITTAVVAYISYISVIITTYLVFHSLIVKDPVYAVLYALTGVLSLIVITYLKD